MNCACFGKVTVAIDTPIKPLSTDAPRNFEYVSMLNVLKH